MFSELLKWLALPFNLPRVLVMLVWAIFVADLGAGQIVVTVSQYNTAPRAGQVWLRTPAGTGVNLNWGGDWTVITVPPYGSQVLNLGDFEGTIEFQCYARNSSDTAWTGFGSGSFTMTKDKVVSLGVYEGSYFLGGDVLYTSPASQSTPPGVTVGGYTVHDLTLGVLIACAILACIVVGWRHGYSR